LYATTDPASTFIKKLLFAILLLQLFPSAESQMLRNLDSVKLLLGKSKSDTAEVMLYANLSFAYAFLQIDTSIAFAQSSIRLARQLQYKEGEAAGMFSYGWAMWASGNYDKAIEASFKSLNLYKDLNNYEKMTRCYVQLAVFYRDVGDSAQALKYGELARDLFESPIVAKARVGLHPYTTLGTIFIFVNQIDSASFYLTKAQEIENAWHSASGPSGYTLNGLGVNETKKKNYQLALNYHHAAIHIAARDKNYFDIVNSYSFIASIYHSTGNLDSSIWYAKEVLSKPEFSIFKQGVLDALTTLAQNYKLKNNNDSTLKYLELRIVRNDSMFNKEKARAIQNLTFNEQLRQQEIAANRLQYQNRLKLYGVLTLSTLFLLIGIILYRNNKVSKKANVLLQQQKAKVESTLAALKSAQSQLIQSEKMASLGELTAGIAHEIQNPLNFVNNFSEVNTELIDEAFGANEAGNRGEVKELLSTLKDNEVKINHHGKRADSIVKGMLQHARTSTGLKEPTDMNALADEFPKLSYQGFRARDKSFNASINPDYDQAIGKINIISQDIGRVLLNLYNNAFYAVSEKKKQISGHYEPTVFVSTRKTDGRVEIKVKDNGLGITEKIKNKIFQPFFTTKPTGQGTGLGLSLSYDIVKAHGGEIKVDTKEGVYTEFTIILPV